jgi:predicted nucleic acid-binding protein
VKVAFDTSVLAAALVASHRDHARAMVWLSAVSEGTLDGVVSVHALSELWSVLTKLVSSSVACNGREHSRYRTELRNGIMGSSSWPPCAQVRAPRTGWVPTTNELGSDKN